MTQNAKDNVRRLLLDTGRRLVTEKGAEYLTARKLSEASGCSIGTIYNQFAKMDDFIAEQNEMTLAELYAYLASSAATAAGSATSIFMPAASGSLLLPTGRCGFCFTTFISI